MMTMIVIVVSTHNINDDVDNDCDLGWDIQMTSSGAVVPYINNAVCLHTTPVKYFFWCQCKSIRVCQYIGFRSNFTKKKLKLVSTGLWEWFLLKTNWISHWSDCSTHHICPRRIINSVILMRCKKISKMILIANLKKKIGSATNSRRTPVQWSESEESSRVWSSCSVVCICLGTVGHNW